MSNTDDLIATIANLKTVMIAAAEEISAHWEAHCDADGYGPANLMRRLEDGIPSEYGYTAGAFAKQAATIAEQARELGALRAVIRETRQALEAANVADNGPIRDTIWMPGRPETLFDFLNAAMQSGQAVQPHDNRKCSKPKCNGNMRPGTYMAQTMSGTPDFPGDTHAVTVSPSGPGRLAECLKCDACGHSVTAGKAVTP